MEGRKQAQREEGRQRRKEGRKKRGRETGREEEVKERNTGTARSHLVSLESNLAQVPRALNFSTSCDSTLGNI